MTERLLSDARAGDEAAFGALTDPVRRELELGATLASFGEDEAGELYAVSRTGTVFRLSD